MSVDTRQLVLLVDDNITNLKVAVEDLKAHELQVIIARSGEAALERASFARPDLILLDVDLPGIDGFETCRRLKADPATKDIPVLFMTALADMEDKLRGFTAGGVDYITKPIQVEEVRARVNTHLTIRALQKNLEERIAELDAFAHTVAHDLKNPLTAVSGYAQLIEQLGIEQFPDVVRESLVAIKHNSRKMTSIIDELLILASVRKMEDIKTGPLAMERIVQDTLERSRYLIDAAGARVVQPDSWPVAQGYGPWIEEVWANYISNAVKYGGTPPLIELGADLLAKGSDGQAPFIRFWVRDNGRGMTEAECGRLFQEFARLDQHRSLQGHGLGLSIVQRIVKKLGGSVGVESRAGTGSLFYFTLPAAAPQPQAAAGVSYDSAPPGRFQEQSMLDDLARRHSSAPVPAQSTPFDPQLGQRRPLRTLVVDDNPTNRQLLALNLAQFGYDADLAGSGLEAVAACARQAYDLIFMDVEMAEMDGLEATRQIRRVKRAGAQLRIIACTANTSPDIQRRCLDAGMDDFVSKPIQPDVLLDIVTNSGARQAAGNASSAGARQEHAASVSANGRPEVLDPKALDRLRAMVGGEMTMLASVIESFLEDSPRLMASLRQAVAQKNAQALYTTAHTLKSLGNHFGAASFAHLCRELERCGQTGNLAGVAEQLPQLEQAYLQVTAALVALQHAPTT